MYTQSSKLSALLDSKVYHPRESSCQYVNPSLIREAVHAMGGICQNIQGKSCKMGVLSLRGE